MPEVDQNGPFSCWHSWEAPPPLFFCSRFTGLKFVEKFHFGCLFRKSGEVSDLFLLIRTLSWRKLSPKTSVHALTCPHRDLPPPSEFADLFVGSFQRGGVVGCLRGDFDLRFPPHSAMCPSIMCSVFPARRRRQATNRSELSRFFFSDAKCMAFN